MGPQSLTIEGFKGLSAGRQLLLVLLTVLLLGGLLASAWFFLLRTPFNPLFTQLRATDAATIVAELDRQKIPYHLQDGGATILVPADKVDSTRLALGSGDLPLKGTVGFELFNKSDMGLTDFAQKINYQRALQGELARTIMTLDRVESARVHLSLGEDRIFRDDRVPPKASITVRMENGGIVSQAAAQGMQRLVAAAVPQLDVANVVILDEEGRVVGGGQQAPGLALLPPPLQERRAIEQYYEARIHHVLDASYPTASIAVTVQANIDGDAAHEWDPKTRDFPLQIILAPGMAMAPAVQRDAQTLASDAIGLDAGLGDTIVIGAPPQVAESWTAADSAQSPARPAPMGMTVPDEPSSSWGFVEILLAGAVLTGAAIVWLAFRRSPIRHRLSADERTAFAARLQAALDQGERHAPQG